MTRQTWEITCKVLTKEDDKGREKRLPQWIILAWALILAVGHINMHKRSHSVTNDKIYKKKFCAAHEQEISLLNIA